MTPGVPFKRHRSVAPVAVLLVAMVSIQCGAALAKGLFAAVGPAGTTALRLAFAAAMLWIAQRPWRLRIGARERRMIVYYGLAMGAMNFLFYSSLSLIPLGIAVALEFTGPLALAIAGSRRAVDFLWVALAILGLAALLPLRSGAPPLAPAGVAYALGAGICWALYIAFGQRAGATHGAGATALGTAVAAAVVVPVGAAHAGLALLAPAVLPAACAVALLSSALPYSLEMFALTRLPVRTFGVLMSLEPALGALSGMVFLGERLGATQWAAVGCIMLASAGSAATAAPAAAPPLAE